MNSRIRHGRFCLSASEYLWENYGHDPCCPAGCSWENADIHLKCAWRNIL